MTEPTEADCAYAAGFFDGEGHIAIAYRSARKTANPRNNYARYWMFCETSQNSPEVLHWLSEHFGGSVRYATFKRSYSDGKYQRWDWCISTQAAASFLRAIRPWLIVKAAEADIAIAFAASVNRNTGRSALGTNVVEFRAKCHADIREIRKRRTSGCPPKAQSSTGSSKP